MASEENRLIVQLSLIDETGDSYHRMRWPAKWVASQRKNWAYISQDARGDLNHELILAADLLLLLQCGDIRLMPLIVERKKRGLKTVVEINDLFYHPQPWNPAGQHWNNPHQWWIYEKFMTEADGIIVSSPDLKKYLDRWKEKIVIFENHIPSDIHPSEKKMNDASIIGWGGSAGHMVDLMAAVPSMNQFLTKNSNWKLRLMGDPSIRDFVTWDQAHSRRVEYTSYSSMVDYFNFLKSLRIGIIPLLDTPYNRCRSDIKALEMIACGCLPIVPKVGPYQKVIQELKIPAYENFSEFETLLQKLTNDRDTANKIWQFAFERLNDTRRDPSHSARISYYESLFPAKSSSRLNPGFKEIPLSQPPTHELESIFNDWRQNKIESAIEKMAEKLSKNPYHAELAAMYILALKEHDFEGARKMTDLCLNDFPHDPRFMILDLVLEPDISEHKWKKLIQTLKDYSAAHKIWAFGFVRDILLKKDLDLQFLNDLKNIFNESPEIRLCVFNKLKSQQKWAEAKAEMIWLDIHYHSYLAKKNFFDKWPSYIPKVWMSAFEHAGSFKP